MLSVLSTSASFRTALPPLTWSAWLVLSALLAGGCQTETSPGRSPATTVTVMAPSPPVIPTVTVPEPPTLAAPAPLPVLPVETNLPVVASDPAVHASDATDSAAFSWPKEWINVWLPLESWGKFNGLGSPIRLSTGTDALFQLQTSNGIVLVKMGSHTANLAGLEYGLGFPPHLIGGIPYIHSLDAQKTFQVLMGVLLPVRGKDLTIVIDPGHGGRDSGTKSIIGRELEKDFTLDWALRVQRLLSSSDYRVVLTRTNDIDVSLADRIVAADRVHASLFISLHLNSGGSNRDLAGVETYCLTPTGMPSNLLREFEDDPSAMHPNNQFDEQNVQLASRLHRSLLQATGAVDRGVRRARFMAVLRGQNRPAVLIEGGYLSNWMEARKLANPGYRQTMAEAVAKALLE